MIKHPNGMQGLGFVEIGKLHRQKAEIERLTEQVESLQQKVHLCAGYDALTIENNNLKQDRTEIHWWCGHEDLTSDRKIQKIMDVCDRDISSDDSSQKS